MHSGKSSWTSSSARATVAVCAASRAGFLTGSLASETGWDGDEGYAIAGPYGAFVDKVADGTLVSLPGFLTSRGLDTSVRGKVDHTKSPILDF